MAYICWFWVFCVFVNACECLLYVLAQMRRLCFSDGLCISRLCPIPQIPHRANKSQIKEKARPNAAV